MNKRKNILSTLSTPATRKLTSHRLTDEVLSSIPMERILLIAVADMGAFGDSGQVDIYELQETELIHWSGNMLFNSDTIFDDEELDNTSKSAPDITATKFALFMEKICGHSNSMSFTWRYAGFGNHIYISPRLYKLFFPFLDVASACDIYALHKSILYRFADVSDKALKKIYQKFNQNTASHTEELRRAINISFYLIKRYKRAKRG